jgi:hypothetical protein
LGHVNWRSLGQSNLGIAVERTKPATYSISGRERPVEHGNAVNPTIPNSYVRKLRINAAKGKGLQRSLYT